MTEQFFKDRGREVSLLVENRRYDDFFASFMFSYLHLLRRHSRNGIPSEGRVITANAAQSS